MTAALTLSFEDGATPGLTALAKAGANLQPILARIGVLLEGSTVERFDAGRTPEGEAWKPSIRARGGYEVAVGKPRKDGSRRTRTAGAGKTLVDTGHLRGSITSVADDSSVEVGTNLIYAGVHQFGATISAKTAGGLKFTLADGSFHVRQSVTIPARPYLGLSAEDRVEIADVVSSALAAAAAA